MPKSGGGFEYECFIKDHLGNTRLTVQDSLGIAAIKQENHYYPLRQAQCIAFGMTLGGQSWQSPTSLENRYLYNGKVVAERKSRPIGKMQDNLGLDWYDYGARFYDPALGRWWAVDPMSEDFHSWSPYNYVFNNPLMFIDPFGMVPTYNWGTGQYEDDDENNPGKKKNVSWDYVKSYINSGIKNAALFTQWQIDPKTIWQTTSSLQGSWKLYAANSFEDGYNKMSQDIKEGQLDNLLLSGHGASDNISTSKAQIGDLFFSNLKPNMFGNKFYPAQVSEAYYLAQIMGLINNTGDGNIVFAFCESGQSNNINYGLGELASMYRDSETFKGVHICIPTVMTYLDKKGEQNGPWTNIKLFDGLRGGDLTTYGFLGDWIENYKGVLYKRSNVTIIANGFKIKK